jgi:hypothetical protein
MMTAELPPTRKRGRPKGSKNKPKNKLDMIRKSWKDIQTRSPEDCFNEASVVFTKTTKG